MSTHWISTGTNALVQRQVAWRPRWRFAAAVSEWRRRIMSRRELVTLTTLDVKDLGYPAGLEAEKCKPFWKG